MSSALAAASLILKPEGYSEGRLQTLKPIEKLGSELITNGDFATDSDWTKGGGWTISNGEAINDGTINAIYQSSSIEAGKKYICKIDITFHSAGVAYWRLGNSSNIGVMSVSGSIEQTLTGSANGTYLGIFTNTAITIDNVSVKEVLEDGGDFTFTRGSNLSATRVNSAGLIEKGRENLLLQSNQFDTTWGNTSSTDTGGQAGYDGTNNAWLLQSTNTDGRIEQSTSYGSGVRTFSAYAKAGTSGIIRLRMQGVANAFADFDLNSGVVDYVDNDVINAAITSVGNGWYRCSINTSDTSNKLYLYVMGASGLNLYIQDAQLEAGMVATDYIETGASTVKAGILENTPRLDYSGGATEPSLLLEPQRTNLFNSSEYFDNWILQTNVNLTHNAINSPEGLINGVKYNISSNVQRAIDQNVTLSNGNTYTFSLYVKAIVDTTIRVRDDFGGWVEDINVLASDGWQRITSTKTITISSTQLGFFDNSGGDGDRFYFYGAQVEQGSYPTSYIPTYGTSVTRNAENKYLQNSSILSSGDGTIFWELDEFDTNTSADGFNQIIYVSKNSDSSLNDTIYLDEYIGTFRLYIRKNNILILRSETGYADLRGSKIAISWNSSGAKIFIDGVENASYVGDASNTFEFFGHDRPYNDAIKSSLKLKQEMYFPTALSDDECIALTTL